VHNNKSYTVYTISDQFSAVRSSAKFSIGMETWPQLGKGTYHAPLIRKTQKFCDMPLRTHVCLKQRKSLKDALRKRDVAEARRTSLKHLKVETKGLMKVDSLPMIKMS